MKVYELFIDELGQAEPKSPQSNLYVLCGCAIERSLKESVRIGAEHIKFKYWNRTDVGFHSREIGKNKGPFSIFKNQQTKRREFLNDLIGYLKNAPISIFVVVCEHQKARELGWNSSKVVKETGKLLFLHFVSWLLGISGAQGKIVIESATAEKDRYYLNEFSYFLSPGCKELSVDYKTMKNILTSISFVTKQNQDIEEQIADLFAYAARCKHLRAGKKHAYKVGSYEDRIIKVLEQKLFRKPEIAKDRKMKFYKAIDPFCVIPKK